MSAPDRRIVVLSVNQDAGIGPGRSKGAAVHLNAMRKAFSSLGVDCHPLDEPDDAKLEHALKSYHQNHSVDMVYERHALGKSAAAKFCRKYDIPLVVEVNAPLAEEQARWRGGPGEEQHTVNDALSLGQAAKVIAVSSEVSRYAVDRGARPERVEVIPNGIDVNRFFPAMRDQSVRRSLIPEGRFVIGFHGRERPWHGFENLVTVFNALLKRGHDVHLLVVGEGDFDALEQLPADRYTRIGWQPYDSMPAYVAAFDVLPLTYHADMPCYFSPLKLREAMGCGVVPLVPSLGDLANIVSHGQTGLVYEPGDDKELLSQLERLMTEPGLLVSLGQQAAEEAKNYSWVSIAEHVLQTTLKLPSQSRDPLQSVFRELGSQGIAIDEVRRVAVERDGVIQIEVHQAQAQRFFAIDNHQIREVYPAGDTKIPASSLLKEAGFAADHPVISYRPGRRMVLDAGAVKPASVLKAYKKRRSAQALDNIRLAESACRNDGFDIPGIVSINSGRDYFEIEKRAGKAPAIELAAVDTWSAIGIKLRAFQDSPGGRELQTFKASNELEVLEERARRLRLCMSGLPADWSKGFKRMRALAERLPTPVWGLAHRDLHDRQFIVSGDRVSLLDFDLLCLADVALDAANLSAHMLLRTLQHNRNGDDLALDACRDAFLDGLDRQHDQGFPGRLLFYQATTCYRLALIYAIRPRWSHLADRLVTEGERCLGLLDQTESGR